MGKQPRQARPIAERPAFHELLRLVSRPDHAAELDQVLGRLATMRSGVDFKVARGILRNAVFAAAQDKRDAGVLNRRYRLRWHPRRQRALREIGSLPKTLEALYRDFAELQPAFIVRERLPDGFEADVNQTLWALDQFVAAVRADPVLQVDPGRQRGNQPDRFKASALAGLRKAGVPRVQAEELLRLFGITVPRRIE